MQTLRVVEDWRECCPTGLWSTQLTAIENHFDSTEFQDAEAAVNQTAEAAIELISAQTALEIENGASNAAFSLFVGLLSGMAAIISFV